MKQTNQQPGITIASLTLKNYHKIICLFTIGCADCRPEWDFYRDNCWGSKEDVCDVKNWNSATVREHIREQQIVDEDTFPDCLNAIKGNADWYWYYKDTNIAYAAIRKSITSGTNDCPKEVDYNKNNVLGQAICDMNM